MKKPQISRYNAKKAKRSIHGESYYFNVVPKGYSDSIIFDWCNMLPDIEMNPETNEANKTFVVIAGDAVISVDGMELRARQGDTVWFPKGSVFTVKTGSGGFQFVCVKRPAGAE
ncbi:MAG: hypothetical protein FWG35_05755 [Spirochaetaceae bacterium]|nr:hypothetical protein [Spirochaetaceae bacterium]